MKHFDYDDINLVPKYGVLNSRNDANTKVVLGGHEFELPIIPANMSSVINEDIAIELASNNYFYILHRFNIDTIDFIEKMNSLSLFTSISVGVTEYWYNIIDELVDKKLSPDYITIDIAHGHSILMKNMLLYIKKQLPKTFIIAGNVSTVEGVNFLKSIGAGAIKIGVGPGSSCLTSMNTGFGSRNIQASTVKDICKDNIHFPIIADGNIKTPGDINKALALGATMCMAGGLFSNLLDSPNSKNTVEKDNKIYVKYWGSASQHESNKTDRIEGTMLLNELIERTYLEQMKFIKDGIQSGISYAGGYDLNSLNSVSYIINK